MTSPGEALRLGAAEEPAARPFAAPAWTQRDRLVLRAVRSALRERAGATNRAPRWTDRAGSTHWLVVPDWDRLARVAPATAIGFFGQAREDVDPAPIVALEHELLAQADKIDGLLAYHNVRFADGRWGNLSSSPRRTTLQAFARTPGMWRQLRGRTFITVRCVSTSARWKPERWESGSRTSRGRSISTSPTTRHGAQCATTRLRDLDGPQHDLDRRPATGS